MGFAIQFSLQKYYVDLVTAEGEYFIGYSALLTLGTAKIHYSATLHDPAITGIVTGPVLSACDSPVVDKSDLIWRAPALGFEGRWQRLAGAETLALHETESGIVEWNCHQPAARTELRTESGAVYDGLGYAEFLNLTIPPWQLGLRTLFWGRFVSGKNSIVWIEWRGDYALNILICNGRKIAGAYISEDEIICNDFTLTLNNEVTIRSGSISETFISKIPSALRSAPIEFLGGREEKFLSRGRLTFADGSVDTGWVIHERVTWGQ